MKIVRKFIRCLVFVGVFICLSFGLVVGLCGNGIVETGEKCDDGNLIGGDGCSATCEIEEYWRCSSFGESESQCWKVTSLKAVDITAGAYHFCSLLDSAQVVCWGYNLDAELGREESPPYLPLYSQEYPVTATFITEEPVPLLALFGGAFHTCSIVKDANNTVKCFGSFFFQDVGAKNPGIDVNGKAVTGCAGVDFTCVVLEDESSVCFWPEPILNTNSSTLLPTINFKQFLPEGSTNQLACAASRVCALDNNGTVICIAYSADTSGQGLPLQVFQPEIATDFKELSNIKTLIGGFSLGDFGETFDTFCVSLENGDTRCSSSALDLSFSFPIYGSHQIIQTVASGRHICFLLSDQTVECMGSNDVGQLGIPISITEITKDDSRVPFILPRGELSPTPPVYPVQIAAGSQSTAVLLNTGKVIWFGSTQAEDPTASSTGEETYCPGAFHLLNYTSSYATSSLAQYSPSISAFASSFSICARTYFSSAIINGLMKFVPRGWFYDTTTLPLFSDFNTTLEAVMLSCSQVGFHRCVVFSDGSLHCFGTDALSGQLGYGVGVVSGQPFPEPVDLGGKRVIQVSTSDSHTCVLLEDLSVKCFGDNTLGQLGLPISSNWIEEVNRMGTSLPAVPLHSNAKQVCTGVNFTCVLLSNNSVTCFGDNIVGQLGQGKQDTFLELSQVQPVKLGVNDTIKKLSCGTYHVCVLFATSVKCWGDNTNMSLGTNSTAFAIGLEPQDMGQNLKPVDINVNGTKWIPTDVATGEATTCVLLKKPGERGEGTTEITTIAKCFGVLLYDQFNNRMEPNLIEGDIFQQAGRRIKGLDTDGFILLLNTEKGLLLKFAPFAELTTAQKGVTPLVMPVCQDGYSTSLCTCASRGTFVNQTRQSTPEFCTPGDFSELPGMARCYPCPPGMGQINYGSITCNNCTAGTFANQSGTTFCSQCPPGYAQPLPGQTVCKKCSNSTYANLPGMTVCRYCPSGQRPLESNQSCVNCDEGMVCTPPFPADVKAGYWRANANSINIYQCNNAQACLGGHSGSACATGYKPGVPLCDVCDSGYYASFGACHKCPSQSVAGAVFFLMIFFNVFLIVFLVWRGLFSSGKDKGAMTKIAINYLQILGTFTGLSVLWNASISNFLKITNGATNFAYGFFASFCAIGGLHFYSLFLFYLILPYASAAFLALVFLIAYPLLKRFSSRPPIFYNYWKLYFSIILVFFYLIYLVVSTYALVIFHCRDIDGTEYLVADMSEECGTSKHNSLMGFAIFVLITFTGGLPFIFVVLLLRHRKKLLNQQEVGIIKFLYAGYRPKTCWWELVSIFRRLAFAALIIYLTTLPFIQVYAAIWLVSLIIIILMIFKPYLESPHYWMDVVTQIALLLTLLSALLFWWENADNPDETRFTGLSIFIVVINCITLFALIIVGIFTDTRIKQKIGVPLKARLSRWKSKRKTSRSDGEESAGARAEGELQRTEPTESGIELARV